MYRTVAAYTWLHSVIIVLPKPLRRLRSLIGRLQEERSVSIIQLSFVLSSVQKWKKSALCKFVHKKIAVILGFKWVTIFFSFSFFFPWTQLFFYQKKKCLVIFLDCFFSIIYSNFIFGFLWQFGSHRFPIFFFLLYDFFFALWE